MLPTRKLGAITTISPVGTNLSVSMTAGNSIQHWRELGREPRRAYTSLSTKAVRREHHSIEMLSRNMASFWSGKVCLLTARFSLRQNVIP
jgi:hypothetical protein